MKNNQLVELYLEQRRSRSGKVQAPNETLFDHIISVYFNTIGSNKKDVIFVPVTINYDRVIEADSFPLELLGESVRRETPFKILKQLMFAKKQFGKVMIRYGQPQSLQENIAKYVQKNNLTTLSLF
jgi:glycerol-3-phosphate O-acyltransferase